LLAAAWFVAVNALTERDEISQVVDALTLPDHVSDPGEDGGKPADVSTPGTSSKPRWSPIFIDSPAYPRMGLMVLFAVNMIAAAPPAQAGRFEFDQRRTEVRFVYKMAYTTQRGRFTKVSGTLDYDEARPEKTKVSASITAASLTTGEALVDNELKGEAFFNVVASPVIAFKSLTVTSRSATAADVAGEITVNGITKPVTLKVSLKPHDDPALKHDKGAREFIATTRIQRSAFNMTDYKSMVDDDIDIEIAAIVRPK
jgi:polyisoprenoid-binding protein YceI